MDGLIMHQPCLSVGRTLQSKSTHLRSQRCRIHTILEARGTTEHWSAQLLRMLRVKLWVSEPPELKKSMKRSDAERSERFVVKAAWPRSLGMPRKSHLAQLLGWRQRDAGHLLPACETNMVEK